MDQSPQVIALGHAIVDVLAPSEDSLIESFGLQKGTMTLVDDEQSEKIYSSLGPGSEASGGSAANTAACLASLGAAVQFIGKVSDDGLGKVFTHDIRAIGVRYEVAPADAGPGTGRCLVMVSPDAEKTMCTNLGAGVLLGPADIDVSAVAAAKVVYIEGYLCGQHDSRAAAIERAIAAARASGTMIAFSGSDPAWVELCGDELRAVARQSDILFANEQEAIGLSGADDLDGALRVLSSMCPTVAVTLGAEGCVVVGASGRVAVGAEAVAHVVDTTGAGDSFAAGFLYGTVRDLGPEVSARLGGMAAAEIVSHLGARPLVSLAERAQQAGLIEI
jgi:sugar/nucleoside kinase (ribokinase family)